MPFAVGSHTVHPTMGADDAPGKMVDNVICVPGVVSRTKYFACPGA
jgi:hypothetical protein